MPWKIATRRIYLTAALVDQGINSLGALLKLECAFYSTGFSVRILNSIWHQRYLSCKHWNPKHIRMLPLQMYMQDAISTVAIRSRDTDSFSHFNLHVSDNSVSSARDRAGVGTALSMRAERVLLDCIPVSYHLPAVWLNGFCELQQQSTEASLSTHGMCLRTHWLQISKDKNELYRSLAWLPQNVCSTNFPTKRRRKGTMEAKFLSHPIESTTEFVSFKFELTSNCF